MCKLSSGIAFQLDCGVNQLIAGDGTYTVLMNYAVWWLYRKGLPTS